MPDPGAPARRRAVPLIGREGECARLDQLVAEVQSGQSQALLVHGQAGVGKTALLEYLAGRGTDGACRVLTAAGVQSEMELAFAGLHQLCWPLRDLMGSLPGPQRDALSTTFGLGEGAVPDRFLVGLAVLSLLADAAAGQPLVCVIDDEQWLDRASAQALALVARRLGAESVGLVFGARTVSAELAGLPEMVVAGLAPEDARTLLRTTLAVTVGAAVVDQIIEETGGNPLALLELPKGLTAGELSAGFGVLGVRGLSASIEASFRRRADDLPPDARRLLLLAGAEPVGDPALLWRAAGPLGIATTAAPPVEEAGLVEFGARVRFRHPLVRSAVYQAASPQERRQVHGALAEAIDPALDPDRRAWHRAHAVLGPDEDVAAELERSAERAQARGGVAAAAAFLERATSLTADPARRANRALAAAHAKVEAGAVRESADLLAMAEAGPLGEHERAHASLVHAMLAFTTRSIGEATAEMLEVANRLAPLDVALARRTFLDTIGMALTADRFASPGADLATVARAAAALPAPEPHRQADLLLDGFAALFGRGYAAGVPILREALTADVGHLTPFEQLQWVDMAFTAASYIWDHDGWMALTDRCISLAREVGESSRIPIALGSRAQALAFAGDLAAAAPLVEEAQVASEVTWFPLSPYGALVVAAVRGDESKATELITAALREAPVRGEGVAVSVAEWANAVLNNGLGRYQEALAAGERASEHRPSVGFQGWAIAEVIEAASRSGVWGTAKEAHRRLAELAAASGSEWALGVEARSHALLRTGDKAEALYRESSARLERTHVRMELARAHLLYGEWLRRERRRADAREQLRTALGMFDAIGMEAFAERARLELRATGETARKRSVETNRDLTPREAQIATMASEGLSNVEIGTRLFISAHTVEYHLRKVFTKLEINSRWSLRDSLKSDGVASSDT
jgi:DNA-binding CsgD family transcriptional regulator/tetratricopeptide (TPR) repeat protein